METQRFIVTAIFFLINLISSQTSAGKASVKLKQLNFPSRVYVGQKVWLKCEYDLKNKTKLYSLKWYKDNKEIYSYMPSSKRPIRIYPAHGVKIDTENSIPEALLLTDAGSQTAGLYSCEVSIYPFYKTKIVHKDMIVSHLPDSGPVLSGFRNKYNGGEYIEGNCTSPKSTPAPKLRFFINDKEISEKNTITYRKSHFGNDLQQATLGLKILLSNEMIQSYKTNIKCTAEISSVYYGTIDRNITSIPEHEARMIISQNQFVLESKKNGEKDNLNSAGNKLNTFPQLEVLSLAILLNFIKLR